LEEGAQITLSAQVVGDRLRIAVSDTGPGLQGSRRTDIIENSPTTDNTSSTGVGLANIQSRLQQAYGENHLFEIRTPAGGGFTVIIEIPFERAISPEDALSPPTVANPAISREPSSTQPIGSTS